jgi:phosphatidylinositol glycan class W
MIWVAGPTLVSMTIGHTFVTWIVALQAVVAFLFGLVPLVGARRSSVLTFDVARVMDGPVWVIEGGRKRTPSVSVFRGGMLLGTALAILAVDFPVFPRTQCKTEVSGTSLMDAGVGAFVFAAGVVARDSGHLPPLVEAWSAIKTASPLLLLGLARWGSVRAADYHEHVSEYGRDLNFFFILALLAVGTVPLRWTARLLARLEPCARRTDEKDN